MGGVYFLNQQKAMNIKLIMVLSSSSANYIHSQRQITKKDVLVEEWV